jgi:hypothetical protein
MYIYRYSTSDNESGGIENATHNTFHEGFDSNTFICHDVYADNKHFPKNIYETAQLTMFQVFQI